MRARTTLLSSRRRWGVLASLGLAAGSLTLALGPATTAAPAAPAVAPVLEEVADCARPALSPALRLDAGRAPGRRAPAAQRREARLVLEVAEVGRARGATARAQALAVSAALAGQVEPGRSATRFYERLDDVRGWSTLPPSIAVHRVLGTPDPFAYERTWKRAVTVLGGLSRARGSVASLVSTAGRAPSHCYASATDPAALPLPPGSAYAVRPRSLVAACGTPVLAALAGTVRIAADPAGGPWTMTVRDGSGVVARYEHLRAPAVTDGQVVTVGQQLGEVGDLGDAGRCELGLEISRRAEGAARTVAAVPFLVERGAAGGEQATTVPATEFRVASYNVLGHHLTGPGGSKRGFGSGTSRVAAGIAKMEAQGVSIAVLNEFESPQAGVFLADGDWGVHRATPNNVFRDGNTNGNAVAWRSDTWEMADSAEFTVPWSTTLHMPVVTLRHLDTGAQVVVIGVHNPASTSRQGNQGGARVMARSVEIGYMQQLREELPGVPIIFMGDMNERSEAFCAFTGTGFLASSAGGSVGSPCSVPSHGPVDWIFGSTELDFTGQFIDRSFLGRISDHPLVTGSVVYPEHEVPEVLLERGDPEA